MKFQVKFFSSICLLLLFGLNSFAQTDSTLSVIDINKLYLDKEFVQTIVVKGEDLEKFTSQNLEEAINVWFFGVYPAKRNIVFVVDGNIKNDINAYSPNDVDEVTLVQNALVMMNGIKDQNLILIKTRNNRGLSGIKAFVSTALIDAKFVNRNPSFRVTPNENPMLFHHYYLGGYKNLGSTDIGLSTDYSRDAFPSENLSLNIDRIRINGYLNSKISNRHSLALNLNYTPQKFNDGSERITGNAYTIAKQIEKSSAFATNLKLSSLIGKRITNTFDGSFNRYYMDSESNSVSQIVSNNSSNSLFINGNNFLSVKNFRLRNSVTYHIKGEDFSLKPALNLYFNNEVSDASLQSDMISNNGSLSSSSFGTKQGIRELSLIPAIDINFRKSFSLNGGLSFSKIGSSAIVSEQNDTYLLPFVSFGYDFKKSLSSTSFGLKIFGSYAKSYSNLNGNQSNLYNYGNLNSLETSSFNNFIPNYYGVDFIFDPSFTRYSNLSRTLQLGVSAQAFQDMISLSYNFDNRNLPMEVLSLFVSSQNPVYIVSYGNYKLSGHSLNLVLKPIQKSNVNWLSGLTLRAINFKVEENYSQNITPVINLINNNDLTLGFVNRISIKKLSFEADFLARLKRNDVNNNNSIIENNSAVNLQNLSLGYKINTSKLKNLEFFVNTRSPYYNKITNLSDGRKYFGLGFRTTY